MTLFRQPLYHYKNAIDRNMKKLYPPNQYFLIRLMKYGKILGEDYHREMGNMYGYKKCCIDNFIKVISEIDDRAAIYMDKKYGPDPPDIHYVRCEKCRGVKRHEKN
jgi:hypothetical protein